MFSTVLGLVTLARGCPNLQSVYIRRCINVTDEAIVQLSKSCRLLRELNIGGCPLVTDESLSALGQNCSSLSSIDFSKANVSKSVINIFRNLAYQTVTKCME